MLINAKVQCSKENEHVYNHDIANLSYKYHRYLSCFALLRVT